METESTLKILSQTWSESRISLDSVFINCPPLLPDSTHIHHPLWSKGNFHVTVVIKNCPIAEESHPVGATVPPNGHSGTKWETCQDSVKLSSYPPMLGIFSA